MSLSAIAARCELFAGLPFESLEACLHSATLNDFTRGQMLVRQGDHADAVYFIVEGTAEVVFEQPDGSEDLIDQLEPGDCVGDLAVLIDRPRTASVRALRSCKAIRIGRADFMHLHATQPDFSLRLARMVAQRLQRTTQDRLRKRQILDVCAVVVNMSDAVARMLDDLRSAIARLAGPVVTLHVTTLADRPSLQSCLIEADLVLVIADAGDTSDTEAIGELMDMAGRLKPRPGLATMLCHEGPPRNRGSCAWLQSSRPHGLHHARLGNQSDVARIARLVTGRATGLALSGGGARGLAHIGVLKALEDAAIPVDFVAGTSMGAILAAQYAAGFGIAQMIEETRRAYVNPKGLPDFAFPSVALYSGRGTDRRLKAMFGDRQIEDLPLPYFAVAADLVTAETVVLESGPVWQAARISCSIPGMLPPTSRDGRLLVDGGLLDNLPVEALRQRCGGRLIASDVSVGVEFNDLPMRKAWPWSRKTTSLPGIAQIMMRTAQLASVRDSRNAGTPADLYLNPRLNDVGMSDFDRIEELIERGATHARERLKNWEICR